MGINTVTTVIPSPALIYQRVRGDRTSHRVTPGRVIAKRRVICKPLKVRANDTMTPMTAFQLPRRGDIRTGG